MRALVTGTTGFIGSNLVHRLIRDGHEVISLVRPSSDISMLPTAPQHTVERYEGGVEDLIGIVERCKPEVVLHLASLFIAEHNKDQVGPLIASNVLFGTELLEAMKQCGVTRIVNAGTSWQHFNSADYDPVCLYAATKEAFQDILEYYVQAVGFRATTLQLFDTYGPNDTRKKIFWLLNDAAKNEKSLAMSPGQQQLEILHVDDAVEAFVIAAKRLLADDVQGSEIFGLPGERLPLRELVTRYLEVSGQHVPIEWGGRTYRTREVMEPWKPKTQLPGWSPKISLAEGLPGITPKR